MRFLFLATKYSVATGDPYMTDELAGGLIERGHSVDVLHLDWDAPLGSATRVIEGRHGEKVVAVAPRALRRFGRLAFRASKFALSSRAAAAAMDDHLAGAAYDAVVAWAPALTVRAPLLRAIRRGTLHRILFVFDFFPMSHREAGMIAGPVYSVAKWLEDSLYRRFTAFSTLLPSNMEYLIRHYPVTAAQTTLWTPIWADTRPPSLAPRDEVRARYDLPLDRPIAIFGGQLSEGRGIEQMLEAARLATHAGSATLYLFIGDGRLRPLIGAAAQAQGNVRLLPPVTRDAYLSLAGACDVGLVATVKEFTSFALPTKTIDYLRVGIPLVTAVEPGSDYPKLLQPYGVSENVVSGDAAAFQAAVERLVGDPAIRRNIASATRRCLDEVFDLRHAVDALLGAVGAGELPVWKGFP